MTYVDTAVRFVIAVLLNGLWEAALLACAAWLALRIMPNLNATTRHWVLSAALVAALVAPIVTTIVAWPHPAQIASVVQSSPMQPASHTREHHIRQTAPERQASARPATAPVPSLRLNLSLPKPVAIAIVVLWLGGAAFVLLRLCLSLWHLERLKIDSLPVAVDYRAQLLRWDAATKGSREVRLCRSHDIEIPIAVGLFDAMILVPERLLEELSPEDVDRIVLHELAHLRRADDWINALERIAQALLFFNPGVLWLVAQLDLEREVACDDWVLQQNEPLPYANCLAKVVESAIWPYRAMSAPGAFITRRAMSIRIERLLSKHRDVRVRTSVAPAGLVLAGLAALVFVAALVSPSIAFSGPPVMVSAHAIEAAALGSARSVAKTVVAKTHAVVASAAPAIAVATPAQQAAPTATAHAVKAASTTPAKSYAATSAQYAQSARSASQSSASGSSSSTTSASSSSSAEVVADTATPDYIAELASAGYTGLTVDEIVQLKAVGVTGDYIRNLAAAGFNHLPVRELVQFAAMGMSPKFVGDMRARFGPSLTPEEIVRLSAVKVTPEFLDGMSRAGYPNLSVEEATRLRAIGIDPSFVQRASEHGLHNLTTEELIRLKVTGIL